MEESGRCEGPICITNTHSCGLARDATIKWLVARSGHLEQWALPVTGETYDGYLNDINGFHVRDEHVFAALDGARGGALEEGSVGGGTGMICYGFKGGAGSASRVVTFAGRDYHVGAFVQTNFGLRDQLSIAGVPVGRALKDRHPDLRTAETGSVIAMVGTDAPLLPHRLKRLARRVSLGIGRSGAISGHGSGDIFLAFSTANRQALHGEAQLAALEFVPDAQLDPFFEAVIQVIDEAVINSLVANETMTGCDGRVVHALPHAEVKPLLGV